MAQTKTTVNGEQLHSQTLDHFTSYPLVSDLLSIYKSNSLGKKSLDIYGQAYDTLAKPFVPYLQTPYSYVAPYLGKADQLGNSTLDNIDSRFPAVTSVNLQKLRDQAGATVHFPFKVAGQARDYVVDTYADEYQKTGGKGVINAGKAVISTEFRIAADVFHQIGHQIDTHLGSRRDQIGETYNKAKSFGQDKVDQARSFASGKYDEAQKVGQDLRKRGEQAVGDAQQKGQELRKRGQQTAEDVQQKGQQKVDEAANKVQN